MFNFLKDKLKEWVSSTKDKLKTEEVKEEVKVEKPSKKEKKAKKLTQSSSSKDEELTTQKADKLIEKAKKQKIKEAPLEFNPALQKYEPDTEKIKEEIQEKEQLATNEDVKRVQEENEKVQEIAEKLEKGEETPDKAIEELEEEHEKTRQFLDSSQSSNLKKSESVTQSKSTTLFKKVGKFFGKKPKSEEPTQSFDLKKSEPATTILTKIKSTFVYKITEEDFNEIFNDLEMLLLENNVALEVVEDIKDKLSKRLINKEIPKKDLESEIKKELKYSLDEILIDPDNPVEAIEFKKKEKEPFVILFFGINGTGKTTSIAKFAHLLKSKKYSVVLAAADTFRAASIEQISEHAKRLDVPLIKHDYGADPSAVGFDAIKYAKAHKIDVVLIDTAGRMHTKSNLLDEMKKICRVTNPDLKIFVAESIAGNDATEQAKAFHDMIDIDGSILTKADVDEKGGTIISISHATHKPIFYLGTGQEYKDLKLFNKEEYIKSLGL